MKWEVSVTAERWPDTTRQISERRRFAILNGWALVGRRPIDPHMTLRGGSAVALTIWLCLSPPALAEEWISGSGNWTDPTNWDNGAVPNSSDDTIRIDNGATVTIDSAGQTGTDILVGTDVDSSLTIQGNGSLTTSNNDRDPLLSGSLFFGAGTLTVTGPQASLTVHGDGSKNGEIIFGRTFIPGGVSNVIVSDGAHVSADRTDIGEEPVGGTINGGVNVTVTDVGTVWNAGAGGLFVGGTGGGAPGGVLTIENGAEMTAGGADIGFGSDGTVTVTGAGSELTVDFDIDVGVMRVAAGNGTLTISDGAVATAGGDVDIGDASQGTVSVTDANSSLDLAGNLFVGSSGGDGSLTISNGAATTAAGAVIGGSGQGIVDVTGANSSLDFTDTLYVGSFGGNGTVTIEDGAQVSAANTVVGFDDTAGTSGTLELDGTPGTQGVLQTTELTKIGGTATVNFDGGILRASANNSNFISGFDAGDVTIQAGGLFLDTNGFSVTAKSGLGGAGTLTKQGAGSLFLTGTNTYTGDTTVEAGTLSLGAGGTTGSILGNVAVDNNARLAFFRSNDVVFDGVISGGGGVVQTGTGTTTLTGISTYTGPTEVAAGTLVVGDSANPTAVITSDTTVDNGATLAGYGTVASIDNNGRVMGGDPGGSLGVLSATGNYTQGAGGALVTYVTQPTTSQVQVSGTAHLSGAAVFNYQPGAYVPAIYPILTSGGGVSGDFDAFAEAGAIPLNLVRSLQYTSGTVNLILSLPTQADTGDDNSIFIDTSGTAQRNTQQATSFLLDDVAAKCKVTDQTCFWFNPLGHFASFDGHGDANSFTSDTGGFMAGGHRLVDDNLTLGVGAGYEYTGIATGDSSANVDTARVFAYGNLDLAPVELSGAIGYAHDWFDTDRANADGLLGVDSANESHQASEYSAGLQLAVPTSIGSVNLRPKIGLQYAYIDESSFDESGAPPLNLHGDSYNHSSLRSFVGLGVSRPFAIDDLILTPSLNLGYARELLSDAQAARLSIDGLPTFRPDNPVTTRNIVTAGIGVDLSNFHGVNFTANYDANIYVGDGVDHTVRLQGRWTF